MHGSVVVKWLPAAFCTRRRLTRAYIRPGSLGRYRPWCALPSLPTHAVASRRALACGCASSLVAAMVTLGMLATPAVAGDYAVHTCGTLGDPLWHTESNAPQLTVTAKCTGARGLRIHRASGPGATAIIRAGQYAKGFVLAPPGGAFTEVTLNDWVMFGKSGMYAGLYRQSGAIVTAPLGTGPQNFISPANWTFAPSTYVMALVQCASVHGCQDPTTYPDIEIGEASFTISDPLAPVIGQAGLLDGAWHNPARVGILATDQTSGVRSLDVSVGAAKLPTAQNS